MIRNPCYAARTAVYDAVFDATGQLVAFVAMRDDSAEIANQICRCLALETPARLVAEATDFQLNAAVDSLRDALSS